MDCYNFQVELKKIWKIALTRYKSGHHDPEGFLEAKTLEKLAEFGLNTMDVFDYVEDFENHGEPDFETFLMICEARRDYFLNEQKGQQSANQLNNAELPSKSDELKGLVWLPRIIPKALGKLRGELPPETMYCCGGDRNFLKNNNVHPAEFLRVVWAYHDDQDRIADWVLARQSA